jgi:hypothetical protein
MDELGELMVSVGAQILIYDLANGCMVSRTGGGAPCVVMPRPGSPVPKTRGQVNDAVVAELLDNGLVQLHGETTPQPCRLTAKGEAFYQRRLKNPSTHM